MPLAGIAFFGWKATPILIIYYVDLVVFFAGFVVLGNLEEPTNNFLEIILMVCGFSALFAYPIVMLGRHEFAYDHYLALACLAQALFTTQSLVRTLREVRERLRVEFSERRREAARRARVRPLAISVLRWLAVIAAAVASSIFVAWSGSTIAMVVTYAAVTLYFELWRPAFLYSGE